jgi:histidinol-phosphatase (PHP family)
MPDYHIHTFRCGHAGGKTREYVEKAVERGLLEIAFTDHIPLYFLPEALRDPTLAMREDQLFEYVEEIRGLQKEFEGKMAIRLALEADYAEGFEEELTGWLKLFEWDFVLGSVHFVSGDWIDAPGSRRRFETEGVEKLYREYYRLLARAAGSGLFDILAHFDLPKKFGYRPEAPLEEEENVAIEAARAAGCAVEISSAGIRKPAAEVYPEARLLRKIVAAGVPITFSSDAHAPVEVGWGYQATRALALDCGARQFVTISNRKKTLHAL